MHKGFKDIRWKLDSQFQKRGPNGWWVCGNQKSDPTPRQTNYPKRALEEPKEKISGNNSRPGWEMKSNQMKPPVEVDPVQDERNGRSAGEAKRHENDRKENKRWFLRRTVGHCYAWRRNWWCVVANWKDGGDREERWENCTNGPGRGGEGVVGERAQSEQSPERFWGVGKP
jgi:hypothetical protein